MSDEEKKSYATPAYLKEVEKGTYQLFRSIVVEEKDPKTGKMRREKVREMLTRPEAYREATFDEKEKIVLRTAHPDTGKMIELVVVE
jgi:hypothetical protein